MNTANTKSVLKSHLLAAGSAVALNALLIVAVAHLFDGRPARPAALAQLSGVPSAVMAVTV